MMRRWKRLLRVDLIAGVLLVLGFAAVAAAAPLIAPPPEGARDPYLLPRLGFRTEPTPPGPGMPLGTLPRQYDTFYGLVWGSRIAFQVGLLVTAGRALVGVLVGLVAGFGGGAVDAVLMRLTDAFMSFPIVAAVLLMITLVTGQRFLRQADEVRALVSLALVLFGWMQYARLVRGNVLAQKRQLFMEAAIATGARPARLLFRHLLPNATQGLLVLIASDIGGVVVLSAIFSFLGLAVSEVRTDWGMMLNLARDWIVAPRATPFLFWYIYMPTSAALVLFSAGWTLIGEGLRDALEPQAAAGR